MSSIVTIGIKIIFKVKIDSISSTPTKIFAKVKTSQQPNIIFFIFLFKTQIDAVSEK